DAGPHLLGGQGALDEHHPTVGVAGQGGAAGGHRRRLQNRLRHRSASRSAATWSGPGMAAISSATAAAAWAMDGSSSRMLTAPTMAAALAWSGMRLTAAPTAAAWRALMNWSAAWGRHSWGIPRPRQAST